MNYTKTNWLNSSAPFINATNLNKIEQALYDLGLLVEPSALLTALKTVDGSGSGLDADTLDGHDTSYFATAVQGGKADTAVQGGSVITTNLLADLEIANAGNSLGALRLESLGDGSTSGAAFLSLKRGDQQIILFGLDKDGKLKVGGGSYGVNSYEILHKSNTKIVFGSSTFTGNNTERTIAHRLDVSPSFANVVPTAATNGYLGDVWVRKDSTNIYVGNSGSFTGAFSWIAQVFS